MIEGTCLEERLRTLGPAMRFVLLLARVRAAPSQLAAMPYAHEEPDGAVDLPPVEMLWELAERYHPEQTWLAELWMRGERTLEELARTAPREALAQGLIEATRRAESRGLWSSASSPSTSPATPSQAESVARRAGVVVAPLWTRVVLPSEPWGVRASLRGALLATDGEPPEAPPDPVRPGSR